MGRSRSTASIRSLYELDLRRGYGDFDAPRLHFVLETVNSDPYSALLLDLSAIGEAQDDTDVNCDVCFAYLLRGDRPLLVQLSMVGPYAVVLAFGDDGFGQCELISPPAGKFESQVLDVVAAHGFRLVPAHHLETSVPLRLVKGRDEVSLYAALFEPEAALPWADEEVRDAGFGRPVTG